MRAMRSAAAAWLLSAAVTVPAFGRTCQEFYPELVDSGLGQPIPICPNQDSNQPGKDITFLWDPDDEPGTSGYTFSRFGEMFEVRTEGSRNFTQDFLVGFGPLEYCAQGGGTCQVSGIGFGGEGPFDWIGGDPSYNLRLFNNAGMGYRWHVKECNFQHCNFPWTFDQLFVNGPDIDPEQPSMFGPTTFSTPNVALPVRTGRGCATHKIRVQGQQGLRWRGVFYESDMRYPNGSGPYAGYPVVLPSFANLGEMRDGRPWQAKVGCSNVRKATPYSSFRGFRITAERAPDAVDPNSMGFSPGFHFDGCLQIKATQPYGAYMLEMRAAKDVNMSEVAAFSENEVYFHPKSRNASFKWCPSPDLGRDFWLMLRGWNEDYGYGPSWGSPYTVTNTRGEVCAVPKIGQGQGARDWIDHVDSCFDDAAGNYRLWDKSRYFNRSHPGTASDHNGNMVPGGSYNTVLAPYGGIYVTASPTEAATSAISDVNNQWGTGAHPADVIKLQQDAIQVMFDSGKFYDMMYKRFGRNGICNDGRQQPVKMWVGDNIVVEGELVRISSVGRGLEYFEEPVADPVLTYDEPNQPFPTPGTPTPGPPFEPTPILHRLARSMAVNAHAWAHIMAGCMHLQHDNQFEARAVIESFADAAAFTMKAERGYTAGEGLWKYDTGATGPRTVFRDAQNPKSLNHPITYISDVDWYPESGVDMGQSGCFSMLHDNNYCGVFKNAEVGNYAFYLLAQGGTHPVSNVAVSGINIFAAYQIWLVAATRYWQQGMSFPVWAGATIRAATDLYGATSAQKVATQKSWQAVGVVAIAANGNPIPTPQPCAGDCDGIGGVQINDTILLLGIVLNQQSPSVCPRADVNNDSQITIADIVLLVNAITTQTCIPAPGTNGLVYYPTLLVTAGAVGSSLKPEEPVIVPFSLTHSDGFVSGVQFDILYQTAPYSSVVCYADESILATHDLSTATIPGGGLWSAKRFLVIPEGDAPALLADGVFAVCEFTVKPTVLKGLLPIVPFNATATDHKGQSITSSTVPGGINIGGCAIVEPRQSSPAILLLIVPLILVLLRTRRRGAVCLLLGVLLRQPATTAGQIITDTPLGWHVPSDCNNNGEVTVDEMVTVTINAMGEADVEYEYGGLCGDVDDDDRVAIWEMIQGVRYMMTMDHCPLC